MAKRKRRIDPEERAYWDEVGRQFREMYERRVERIAAWEAADARRKERLRRLTFGMLGRT